ncbi:unnamed protein product [Meganyctiphanes norvegica]|uniref:Integral membrane protein n=1 Tax=Meganyctiphanes norvegica TaxID=48144 RepID=A0AAV2SKV3_MEGNR
MAGKEVNMVDSMEVTAFVGVIFIIGILIGGKFALEGFSNKIQVMSSLSQLFIMSAFAVFFLAVYKIFLEDMIKDLWIKFPHLKMLIYCVIAFFLFLYVNGSLIITENILKIVKLAFTDL